MARGYFSMLHCTGCPLFFGFLEFHSLLQRPKKKYKGADCGQIPFETRTSKGVKRYNYSAQREALWISKNGWNHFNRQAVFPPFSCGGYLVRRRQQKSDVRMATKGNAQRDCTNGEQEQERGDTEMGIFQGSHSRLSWPRPSYETCRHSTAKPKFHGFMQIHAQLLTFTLADFLLGYFVPGGWGELETATRMEKHGAPGSRPINVLLSTRFVCLRSPPSVFNVCFPNWIRRTRQIGAT